MDEFGSIREVDNVNIDSTDKLAGFMQQTTRLREWLRRTIVFICYVPGVFGFLWLIGRILKR
jgi:hypothetical protein